MRSPECDSLMIVIIIIIIQFLQMSYRLHTNGRAHSAIYWEPWIYAPPPVGDGVMDFPAVEYTFVDRLGVRSITGR